MIHQPPAPVQVRAAAALNNIRQVDEEELEVIVGSTIEKPTVIDFYATWCGPCLLLAQELEKVGRDVRQVWLMHSMTTAHHQPC